MTMDSFSISPEKHVELQPLVQMIGVQPQHMQNATILTGTMPVNNSVNNIIVLPSQQEYTIANLEFLDKGSFELKSHEERTPNLLSTSHSVEMQNYQENVNIISQAHATMIHNGSQDPVYTAEFSSGANLIEESIPLPPMSPAQTLECNICGKLYKRKSDYLKHLNSADKHASPEKEFTDSVQCCECDEIVSHGSYHSHVLDPSQSGTVLNRYSCSICHRYFASKDSWLAHLQSGVHDKMDFPCVICSFSFKTPGELIDHVHSHQLEKTYSCPECPQKFVYQVSLHRHSTSHAQKAADEKDADDAATEAACETVESDDDNEAIEEKKSEKTGPFTCEICGSKYVYRQGLRKHQRKVHGAKQSYPEPRSCSKCTKTFIKAWYLKEHEKFCTGMPRKQKQSALAGSKEEKCPVCDQTFTSRKRMLAHKRDSHRPRLVCDICGKSFTRRTSLRKHIQHSHEGRRDFICGNCGKQFTTASSLQRHERLHIEARPFKCTTCDRAYSTSYLLIVHNETHIDEKEKNYQCERCAHRFSRLLSLKHHSKRTCERRVTVRPSDQGLTSRLGSDGKRKPLSSTRATLPCTMCKRRFRSETVLARHIRFMHNDDSSLTCPLCGLIFRTLPCFRKHQALHNGVLHRCRYCQKTFMNENTMIIHERRQHTGETPFACTVCGESFVTERKLVAHQLVHVGKEIRCDYCPAIFASRHERDKHARRHTGEKPHICLICARGFSTKRLMETHIRTHTGERPFSCNICSAHYAEARGLKNHIRTSHPERGSLIPKNCPPPNTMILPTNQIDPTATHHIIPNEVNVQRIGYDRQVPLVPVSHSDTMIFFQKL